MQQQARQRLFKRGFIYIELALRGVFVSFACSSLRLIGCFASISMFTHTFRSYVSCQFFLLCVTVCKERFVFFFPKLYEETTAFRFLSFIRPLNVENEITTCMSPTGASLRHQTVPSSKVCGLWSNVYTQGKVICSSATFLFCCTLHYCFSLAPSRLHTCRSKFTFQ